MFCKKCGKQIKDGMMFCPRCGQKVTVPTNDVSREAKEIPAGVQEAEEPAAEIADPASRRTGKPSAGTGVPKSLILAVITGILIVAVAVPAFMLLSKHSKEEESDSSQGYGENVEGLEVNHRDASEMPIGNDEAGQPPEEVAEEEPVQEEQEQGSEYILPESDSAYLTMSDLEGLTKEECRIARNELYARHGRRFDDEELQGYFDSCSWYEGTTAPADFDDSVLNEYEMANRDLIVRYEEEQGYR